MGRSGNGGRRWRQLQLQTVGREDGEILPARLLDVAVQEEAAGQVEEQEEDQERAENEQAERRAQAEGAQQEEATDGRKDDEEEAREEA